MCVTAIKICRNNIYLPIYRHILEKKIIPSTLLRSSQKRIFKTSPYDILLYAVFIGMDFAILFLKIRESTAEEKPLVRPFHGRGR